MSPKEKVYQEVLKEIRNFIDHNNLQSGDKLPSERELSEKLRAGRSSVREALRAMELLGLIETRRGEGTFLSTYRPYQTVQLLASFILREENTKKDLLFAKLILEKEAAKLAFCHLEETDFHELTRILDQHSLEQKQKHLRFFNLLFVKTENLLLAKIWKLMEDFSHNIHTMHYQDKYYFELIQLYKTRNYQSIETLFGQIIAETIHN